MYFPLSHPMHLIFAFRQVNIISQLSTTSVSRITMERQVCFPGNVHTLPLSIP